MVSALVAGLWGTAAWADQVFIQIEARQTQELAEARAAEWAAEFPDLVGHRLKSGWFGMALGPMERAAAEPRLRDLKAAGLVPQDSYLSTGTDYREPFWPPAGLPGALPGAPVGAAPEAVTEAPPVGAAPLETPPAEEAPVVGAPAELPDAEAPVVEAPVAEAPVVEAPVTEAPVTEAAPVVEPPVAEVTPAAPHVTDVAPAAPPPPTAAELLKAARAAEKALDRAARQEIQAELEWFGHYKGAHDGDFGPGTRAAIAAWQTANGLPDTGVLTEAERARLHGDWQADVAALGLAPLDRPDTGIDMLIPAGLVQFDRLAPPFAIFTPRDGSGVELYLISRPGDAAMLGALTDLVAGLDVLPEGATRKSDKRGFTLDGETGTLVTHAEARLEAGAIRGFVLVWPLADRARQEKVLPLMRDSFKSVGEAVLDPAGATPLADAPAAALGDLQSGQPQASGSGFFVGADGAVLTAESLTHACRRLTVEGVPARMLASDPETGLAYLRPERVLAPPQVARLASAEPARGDAVALAGYSWPGALPAAVLSHGSLTAASGALGQPTLASAAIAVQPGDIGGPVLDVQGQVLGLVVPPPPLPGRDLPPDMALLRIAPALAGFLEDAGASPAPAPAPAPTPAADEDDRADAPSLSRDDLARLGRDLTVEVVCY